MEEALGCGRPSQEEGREERKRRKKEEAQGREKRRKAEAEAVECRRLAISNSPEPTRLLMAAKATENHYSLWKKGKGLSSTMRP